MRSAIVIPARYGSTRFPGKPMANILGKSLLERTWCIAKAVGGVEEVVIATDDERIAMHASAFGAKVQMTNNNWRNGSERSLEALQLMNIKPEIVVNLQGDAVLTPPSIIETLLTEFFQTKNSSFAIATPCVQLTLGEYQNRLSGHKEGKTSGTMVTFDLQGRALYFSRALIPYPHSHSTFNQQATTAVPAHRHIGLYAFRYESLCSYVNLKPTPLEKLEGLEQLRALEHGLPIKVVPVDYHGRTHWSVDHPHDIAIVEEIIKKEGELIPSMAKIANDAGRV